MTHLVRWFTYQKILHQIYAGFASKIAVSAPISTSTIEFMVVFTNARPLLGPTWWLIPLSKWVITPVISGFTLLIPFITGVITHLLSGMSHQALGPSLSQLRRKHLRRLAKLEELGRMHGELRRGTASARACGSWRHTPRRYQVGAGRVEWTWGILPGKMAMDCWEDGHGPDEPWDAMRFWGIDGFLDLWIVGYSWPINGCWSFDLRVCLKFMGRAFAPERSESKFLTKIVVEVVYSNLPSGNLT